MGNCGTRTVADITRAYVGTPDWKIWASYQYLNVSPALARQKSALAPLNTSSLRPVALKRRISPLTPTPGPNMIVRPPPRSVPKALFDVKTWNGLFDACGRISPMPPTTYGWMGPIGSDKRTLVMIVSTELSVLVS